MSLLVLLPSWGDALDYGIKGTGQELRQERKRKEALRQKSFANALVLSCFSYELFLDGNGQKISKVCNMCSCHISDLTVEDIIVKPKWANSSNMTFKYSNGEEITRTELP